MRMTLRAEMMLQKSKDHLPCLPLRIATRNSLNSFFYQLL